MPLLIISFIAGVLTILAPCILPLLPVIVGRSISDSTLSKRRVFTVITSLGISVIAFTLILKVSTLFINIPQDFWKYTSGGIIIIFGLVTLFPNLWENLSQISFASKITRESNKTLMAGYQRDNIWGDIIVGASLGPIFSACSPTYFVILATVLPVSPVVGMIYLFTYTLGLCLALLLVAVLGQKIMSKLNLVSDSHGWFKRTLGIIFILVGIGILSGYDKQLQITLLDGGFFDVTKVEQNLLRKNTGENNNPTNLPDQNQNSADEGATTPAALPQNDAATKDTPKKASNDISAILTQKNKKFVLAPEISTPDGFINTDGKPVTIGEFKGKKVVLLDIWTYSCINCIRTIPYLNDWYKKYKDQGLEIIGLHTPEFAFEKVQKNVADAVKRFAIQYPVVLDNDFSTWNAYQNQYWPRKYLIDVDGYIVYDHAGEGNDAQTEQAIRSALLERNDRLQTSVSVESGTVDPVGKVTIDENKLGSPEIYFGSARNEYLANGDSGFPGAQNLTIPNDIKLNNLYLGGTWTFTDEYAESSEGDSVVFKYKAKNVYIVASSQAGADVQVYIDGNLTKTISIKDEILYTLIEGADYGEHTLMLKIPKAGLKAFTFTFG